MSARAFLMTRDNNKWTEADEMSFNYSHSHLERLLNFVGRKMPFDDGVIGVPLVIYEHELRQLFDLIIITPRAYLEDVKELLRKIKQDMGDKKYVIYFLT